MQSTPVYTTYSTYTLMKVYSYYRLLLTSILLALYSGNIAPTILGDSNPKLYGFTISIYFVLNLITLIRLLNNQFNPDDKQLFIICLIDIVALTLLMDSSGGISSGIGLLIFITITASALIMQGQICTFLAAIATIAVIAESVVDILFHNAKLDLLMPSGLLGILIFSASLVFQYFARKMRIAAEQADMQALLAQQLQELNQLIVQRMLTGIIVLSPQGQIRLINDSAGRLLDLPAYYNLDGKNKINLVDVPALQQRFLEWKASPHSRLSPIRLREHGPEVQLSFTQLEKTDDPDVLIFVEDTRQIAQQAQQMKLASLGHLTASIAHEVRNPLGAISHAAQLLAESGAISSHDVRLTEIIQNHSKRVNQIIENVLQLSRRANPKPEKISLKGWLQRFSESYRETHSSDSEIDINLQFAREDITITFDPSQLEQVLTNLADNGLRYSKKATGKATLTLRAYIDRSLDMPCLDIIDDGPGISAENQSKIFEPFFTTDSRGTGLGLYLSREICEANQARLDYQGYSSHDRRSCFQISFAHSEKTF